MDEANAREPRLKVDRQTRSPEYLGNYRGDLKDIATHLWPTPDAQAINDGEDPATFEARRETLRAKGYNGNGAGTPLTVASLQWQTPHGFANTDQYGKTGGGGGEMGKQAVAWFTPDASCHKGTQDRADAKAQGHAQRLQDQTRQVGRDGARRLNSRFVEWLMGIPIDWTAEVPRVDRLRCLGNAVVAAQACYAIALLVQEIAAYRQTETPRD